MGAVARKDFIVQHQLGLHSESRQTKRASQRNIRKKVSPLPVNMFWNVHLMGVCMCVFVYVCLIMCLCVVLGYVTVFISVTVCLTVFDMSVLSSKEFKIIPDYNF